LFYKLLRKKLLLLAVYRTMRCKYQTRRDKHRKYPTMVENVG